MVVVVWDGHGRAMVMDGVFFFVDVEGGGRFH
jgi:hypothetical protein